MVTKVFIYTCMNMFSFTIANYFILSWRFLLYNTYLEWLICLLFLAKFMTNDYTFKSDVIEQDQKRGNLYSQ